MEWRGCDRRLHVDGYRSYATHRIGGPPCSFQCPRKYMLSEARAVVKLAVYATEREGLLERHIVAMIHAGMSRTGSIAEEASCALHIVWELRHEPLFKGATKGLARRISARERKERVGGPCCGDVYKTVLESRCAVAVRGFSSGLQNYTRGGVA